MAHNLFKDFPQPSGEDWLNRIQKDLKGKELDSLVSESPEGIRIQPVYTMDDLKPKGQAFRNQNNWNIVQEILVIDTVQANKLALYHLNQGASALLFYLAPDTDLKALLKNILIEHIAVHFITNGNGAAVAKQLNEVIHERKLDAASVYGSINIDFLENLARTGNWLKSEEEDLRELKNLGELTPPNIRPFCVNTNLFGHAGATLSQQLGITLAMVYEYIYRLELKDAERFWLNTAIGSDYFGEIAKLRALRNLWSQLLKELELPEVSAQIYAETSLRNKTILDAYNNMIRTSAETMAAGIGGCDEFSVKGFDQTFREPGSFGERIAKNQQHILQHESHLGAVRDISAGAYFIEKLTEELALKGWDFFKSIEARGGYLAALQSGWLQDEVEAKASQEQTVFDQSQQVLIGANKYRKKDENLKEIIEHGHFYKPHSDHTAVRPLKVKRLSEQLEKDY